jgi:hypothetical protein
MISTMRILQIMWKIPLIFIPAAGPVMAGKAPAQPLFLEGIKDVPLMPGFREIDDSRMVFDTTGGRIIDSEACGMASPKDVRGFYAAALPELGWAPVGGKPGLSNSSLAFTREGDRLEIRLIRANLQHCSVKLHFSLTPD